MNSGRRLRRSWLHLLGVYSTCLYSIGSSAACQQSASRLKCENCETQRKSESKNRPVATNFQFSKILAPLGQLLVGACLPQTLLGTSTANWNLSGRDPSILLRKTVLSLKSPTGAFIVPLRSTNANCLLLRLRRNKQHDCHKNI